MKTADEMFTEIVWHMPRSQPFKEGVLAGLRTASQGVCSPHEVYEVGTTSADAYFAGKNHGRDLWDKAQPAPVVEKSALRKFFS